MPPKKKTEAKKDPNVGDYPERPLKDALADEKDIAEAEARSDTDQIEDYHQKHPTRPAPKAEDSPDA